MVDPRTSVVLETMWRKNVECLLTGGQACVIYGAAEFSKVVDFVILANSENFERIRKVADELDASVIAVPPFEKNISMKVWQFTSAVDGLKSLIFESI